MRRISPYTKVFSRKLRSEMTETESHLWQYLRARQLHGFKFRRQHPAGKYILDFACIDAKLAIEVDGSQHSEMPNQDNLLTAWLEAQEWRVLRFWNSEALLNVTDVLEVISNTLTAK